MKIIKYITVILIFLTVGGVVYFVSTEKLSLQEKNITPNSILPSPEGKTDAWGVDPQCKTWHDGCNSCSRGGEQGYYYCTTMACSSYGVKYCIEYF